MTSDTKVKFTVTNVLDGWESLRSPDDVYVTIELPDDSAFEVFAPVVELVESYEHVVEEEPWDTVFGTGHVLEIEPAGGEMILRIDDIDEVREFRIDSDRVEREIRTFVRSMFRAMDEVGPQDSRETILRRYDAVHRVYAELST